MTNSSDVACPHCAAANPAGAQFCESCGKALPSAFYTGPRVVDGSSFAVTAAGQKLQSQELQKQAKKAAGALLAVAIIRTIVLAVIAGEANSINRLPAFFHSALLLSIGGSCVIFWVLYFWARAQPLPAAIVGLVLYATLVAINMVSAIGELAKGNTASTSANGIGGLGIGWIDVVILAVLSQAITAGAKYRKLMQTNA